MKLYVLSTALFPQKVEVWGFFPKFLFLPVKDLTARDITSVLLSQISKFGLWPVTSRFALKAQLHVLPFSDKRQTFSQFFS